METRSARENSGTLLENWISISTEQFSCCGGRIQDSLIHAISVFSADHFWSKSCTDYLDPCWAPVWGNISTLARYPWHNQARVRHIPNSFLDIFGMLSSCGSPLALQCPWALEPGWNNPEGNPMAQRSSRAHVAERRVPTTRVTGRNISWYILIHALYHFLKWWLWISLAPPVHP